jgi:hypothetical protein
MYLYKIYCVNGKDKSSNNIKIIGLVLKKLSKKIPNNVNVKVFARVINET